MPLNVYSLYEVNIVRHCTVCLGKRRNSEISPLLFSGSGLYKNLSIFPSHVFLLPTGSFAISVHQILPPFFKAFIFLLFYVQVQSSVWSLMDSLLVCFAKHIILDAIVQVTQLSLLCNAICVMCQLGRLGNWALVVAHWLYKVL